MAGTGFTVHLDPIVPPPPTPFTIRNQYAVEYGRFLPYSLQTSADHHRLVRRQKIRPGEGTWMSTSSASLQLLSCGNFGSDALTQLVLLIASGGGAPQKVLEEHYVSKLHFSWPQLSCVSQSDMKGSRVVFASYKNSLDQVEKFAIRFFNSSESNLFINILKESLKNVREIGMPCSNMPSESQPINPFINSDEMHHSNIPIVRPIKDEKRHASSEQATFPNEFRAPSFTSFLCNSISVAREPPRVSNAVDMMALQSAKLMSPASFYDMLSKLDKVISETGGNLAL